MRWSDGLHQAVEAKENVRIQGEPHDGHHHVSKLVPDLQEAPAAYRHCADGSAGFSSTYKLDVFEIPTNRGAIRTDDHDVVYKTEREKFNALTKDIVSTTPKGARFVGTTSVEKSAAISRILTKKKIEHAVLTPSITRRSLIVAQAGRKGSITVSTNMAGRGTDIMLGATSRDDRADGLQEAESRPRGGAGGLRELVKKYEKSCKKSTTRSFEMRLAHHRTERHESRRIDITARARGASRPGYSKFYLSLEMT